MPIDVRQLDLGSFFDPADYMTTLEGVLRDPATRYRLRNRIGEDASVDPVDAVADAFVLYELAKLRLREMLAAEDDSVGELAAQAIARAMRPGAP